MTLYDSGESEKRTPATRTSIVVGKVSNNCDLILQGKVRVRLPSLDQDVWARICAPGAGKGGGLSYTPHDGDEVLVAFNEGPTDSYIIGGLWNTIDKPPLTNPLTSSTTRVFKTGNGVGLSHNVIFDDLKQSITITSSTDQSVTLSPDKIEVALTGGKTLISLDMATQSITLKAVSIKLDAKFVQIKGDVQTEVKGGMVYINSPAPPAP